MAKDDKQDTTEVTTSTPAAAGDVDRVAMVSRTKDGKPDQSDGYQVLHRDGATAEERKAAENR